MLYFPLNIHTRHTRCQPNALPATQKTLPTVCLAHAIKLICYSSVMLGFVSTSVHATNNTLSNTANKATNNSADNAVENTREHLTHKLIEKAYYFYDDSNHSDDTDSNDGDRSDKSDRSNRRINNSIDTDDIQQANATGVLAKLTQEVSTLQNSKPRDIGEWVSPARKQQLMTTQANSSTNISKSISKNIDDNNTDSNTSTVNDSTIDNSTANDTVNTSDSIPNSNTDNSLQGGFQDSFQDGFQGGFRALADYGYYDNQRYAELRGNVIVQQDNQTISAENIRVDLQEKTVQATAKPDGNVIVQQNNQTIKAKTIQVDLQEKTVQAEGEVFFNDAQNDVENNLQNNAHNNAHNNIQGNKQGTSLSASSAPSSTTSSPNNTYYDNQGLIGFADKISFNRNDNTAKANDFAFASIGMQAHGYAQSMEKLNPTQYTLNDVMFSTCPPNKLNWKLDASSINLDTASGRGESFNNRLSIRDVPVAYLPYFNFPINDKRKSGFLTPRMSLTADSGLEIKTPYYFNIAPNYDATLTPRVFTNRNPMLDSEFRYLTQDYGEGLLHVSYLPQDKKYAGKSRSSVFFNHEWQPTYWQLNADTNKRGDLTVTAQYNHLSDIDFNNDFDYMGVVDNNLNLPRSIRADYSNQFVDAQLKVETFQELEAKDIYGNPIEDKDRPYARLPQLLVDYQLPKLKDISNKTVVADGSITQQIMENEILNNLEIKGYHDSAYFKKSINDGSAIEQNGFRMYNKLSTSYPFIKPWGYIKPNISLQSIFSSYEVDDNVDDNIDNDNNTLDNKDNSREVNAVFVPQMSIDAMATLSKQGAPETFFKADAGGYQLLEPRLKYSYAPYRNQNRIPNFNTRIASVSYEQLFADTWFLGHDRVQDLHAITPGINYRYIDKMGNTRIDASIAQQFYLDAGQVSLEDFNSDTQDTSATTPFTNSSGLVASVNIQPYQNVWIDTDLALDNDSKPSYVLNNLRYKMNSNTQFSLGFTQRFADDNTNQQALSALTGSAIMPINQRWRVIAQTQYNYDNNRFLDSLFGIDYEDCCVGFTLYGRRYANDFDVNDDINQAIMAEVRLKGLSDKSSKIRTLLAKKIINYREIDESWKRNISQP